jgi:hypothetical protein
VGVGVCVKDCSFFLFKIGFKRSLPYLILKKEMSEGEFERHGCGLKLKKMTGRTNSERPKNEKDGENVYCA